MKSFFLVIFILLFSTLCTGNCWAASKIKVAVIDTGLNLHDPRFADVLCPTGHKDFTGEGIEDRIGHGTHVAGILMRAAPDHSKYCLVIYKAFPKYGMQKMFQAITYASAQRIPLVNLSVSGQEPDDMERNTMALSSAVFVVAAGNNNEHYKMAFPGGYGLPNVFPVGNWDCAQNIKDPLSNFGEGVNWRCGTNVLSTIPGGKEGYLTGTSQATPLYTAEVIGRMTK